MIRKRARMCKQLRRFLGIPWDSGRSLFLGLTEWRNVRGKRWSLEQVFTTILLAMTMGAMSFRRMEEKGKAMGGVVQRMFKLAAGLSDNTFARILAGTRWQELQERLWWQVRAMRERHQLVHDQLPLKTLALDGKCAASGTKKMSRFAQKSRHEVKDEQGRVIRTDIRYKLHLLRAVCTSVRQKLCVYQHPVRSKANEITGAKVLLKQLFRWDKGRDLFELITFDAMFMNYPLAELITKAGRHFLGALKDNQPGLRAEAERLLRPERNSRPEHESGLVKDHKYWKMYRFWRTTALAGCVTSEHTWDLLKEGWCVEIIRYTRTGKERGKKAQLVEFDRHVRYLATSLDSKELTAAQCLHLVLSHWSIEDDCFNSLDLQWKEDTHVYCTTGEATLNRCFVLMMAYNICQMVRRRKKNPPQRWDGKKIWETWSATFDFIQDALDAYFPANTVRSERMLTH